MLLIIILLFFTVGLFSYNENTTAVGFVGLAGLYYISFVYLLKNLTTDFKLTKPGEPPTNIFNAINPDVKSLLEQIKNSNLMVFLTGLLPYNVALWITGAMVVSIFVMLAAAITIATKYVIHRANHMKSVNLYLNKDVNDDMYGKNPKDETPAKHYELAIVRFLNMFFAAIGLLFALILSFLFVTVDTNMTTYIRLAMIIGIFGVSIAAVNHASLMRKIVHEEKIKTDEKQYRTKNRVEQVWQDILTFFNEPSL